jgi:hypothetical protein
MSQFHLNEQREHIKNLARAFTAKTGCRHLI